MAANGTGRSDYIVSLDEETPEQRQDTQPDEAMAEAGNNDINLLPMDLDAEIVCVHSSQDESSAEHDSIGAGDGEDPYQSDEPSEGNNRNRRVSWNPNRNKKRVLQRQDKQSFNHSAGSSKVRRLIGRVVMSSWFESVIAAVIVTNVIYMGWATNYLMEDTSRQETKAMQIISLCYCLAYTVELAMRIAVFGPDFCRLPERNWNIFDGLLVLQSAFEQMMYWGNLLENSIGGLVFLRILRLGKLVKMLRIIRLMRSMREMRLILFSIMGSVRGMFWSFCLILFVLYMFSLVFVHACIDALKRDMLSIDVKRDIASYWSSVELGMLSLFEASTGGDDWVRIAAPLKAIGIFYYMGFCMYIAFFLFVLMNTITSLFVESTFETANKDHQFQIQGVLDKKAQFVKSLQILFNEADDNNDGMISEDEFAVIMADPRMRAFAESLYIEISDVQRFFDLLTENGTRHLDVDTFVDSCTRMRGQALSIDVQDILMRLRRAQEHRTDFFDGVNRKLQEHDRTLELLRERAGCLSQRVRQVSRRVSLA